MKNERGVCSSCDLMGFTSCRLEGGSIKTLTLNASNPALCCPYISELKAGRMRDDLRKKNDTPINTDPISMHFYQVEAPDHIMPILTDLAQLRTRFPRVLTQLEANTFEKRVDEYLEMQGVKPQDKDTALIMRLLRGFVDSNPSLFPSPNPDRKYSKNLEPDINYDEDTNGASNNPAFTPDAKINDWVVEINTRHIAHPQIRSHLFALLEQRPKNLILSPEESEKWEQEKNNFRMNPDIPYGIKVTVLSRVDAIVERSKHKFLVDTDQSEDE